MAQTGHNTPFAGPSLPANAPKTAHELVQALDEYGEQPGLSPKDRRLLRRTAHTVSDGAKDHTVVSWKMADYAYKRSPCPFPTRARGLFTETIKDEHRIVVRGYDKFFNVGEVPWTRWNTIEDFARPPYELTVKSNGCIIFISALSPDSVIVTSKHAVGGHAQRETSHAQRGEHWLELSLKKVGKTKQQLANVLWDSKLTAVAELCDDSFEEHVLAYKPEETGLHLHGVNLNTPELVTWPSERVRAFAIEWGFLPTEYLTMNSVDEIKSFTDECAKTGKWQDKYIEGFVCRGALVEENDASTPNGNDIRAFMWKVKFDEPYLMWREWRELTKKILSAHAKDGPAAASAVPEAGKKSKKAQKGKGKAEDETTTSTNHVYGINVDRLKRAETRQYVRWVKQLLEKEGAEAFGEFLQGRGIVAARERFFEWRKTQGAETGETNGEDRPFDRTLLVPVAVPGCGKTLVGLALEQLYGWPIFQSDDVQQAKTAPTFVKTLRELLQKPADSPDAHTTVVFADRNNHLLQHREQMIGLADSLAKQHRVRLIALVWGPGEGEDVEAMQQTCSDRIVGRGERHQSLRADLKTASHEAVLKRFLHERDVFDPIDHPEADGAFDEVIRVPVELEPEAMVTFVVEALAPILGIQAQRPDRIAEAVQVARGFDPKIRKAFKDSRAQEARYYGVALKDTDFNLLALLRSTIGPRGSNVLLDALQDDDRIELRPHVTLAHSAEKTKQPEMWTAAGDLAHRSAQIEVVFGPRIAWDERVIAIEVGTMEGLPDVLAHRFHHVTVGYRKDAKPIEGRLLFEKLGEGETESEAGGQIHVHEMKEPLPRTQGVVRALF